MVKIRLQSWDIPLSIYDFLNFAFSHDHNKNSRASPTDNITHIINDSLEDEFNMNDLV